MLYTSRARKVGYRPSSLYARFLTRTLESSHIYDYFNDLYVAHLANVSTQAH